MLLRTYTNKYLIDIKIRKTADEKEHLNVKIWFISPIDDSRISKNKTDLIEVPTEFDLSMKMRMFFKRRVSEWK